MGNPSNVQPTTEGPTPSSSQPETSSVRRRSSVGSSSMFMASVSRAMSRVASRISMNQTNRQIPAQTTSSNLSATNRLSTEPRTTAVQVEGNRNQMSEEEVRRTLRGTWPIRGSSFFACLSCLLGLYNISRFAMMVFLYKGPFLFQFLLLSIVLGIPFLFLMVALGQYLGSGMLDMWYISPAFKGVGVALLYAYVIIGIYTAVPISWMFIYFKDSFITAREPYKWALCNTKFATEVCVASLNSSKPDHAGWTVPSYFHGQVLEHRPQDSKIGEVKFELAFNLTVVWFIVFLTLSRGIRSYGKPPRAEMDTNWRLLLSTEKYITQRNSTRDRFFKRISALNFHRVLPTVRMMRMTWISTTVFAMNIFPISLLIIISIRFLEQWGRGVAVVFAAPWKPILSDPWSWVLAAREVFFTWVIFGGVVLQHSSHNKSGVQLTRVVMCLATITLICLLLASTLIACSIHALLLRGLTFSPTSFEEIAVTKVLRTATKWPALNFDILPVNLFAGECLVKEHSSENTSGYQSLRLATEVFPALLAMEGARRVSSFWAISFYGMLIMFGIGQQVSLWACVVESIISLNYKKLLKWQTILTFILCTLGLLLGLPFTTNLGMSLVYFFDFCIGSLWWIASIYLIMLTAVLLIRGRPYGTDQLVGMVTKRTAVRVWLLPVLIFQWNVLLPAVFLVFSISFVRTGQEGSTHSWFGMAESYQPWPPWVKQLAVSMQTTPLLGVFFICAYQAIRYIVPSNDIPLHQKIQSLCCPVFPPSVIASSQRHEQSTSGQSGSGIVNAAFEDDPPPKYTPPPSYSSATAKKLASKFLRHSNSFPDIEKHASESDLSFQHPMPLKTSVPNVFVLPSCEDQNDQEEQGTFFCNSRSDVNSCKQQTTDVFVELVSPNSENTNAMSHKPYSSASACTSTVTDCPHFDLAGAHGGCTNGQFRMPVDSGASTSAMSDNQTLERDSACSSNRCSNVDIEPETSGNAGLLRDPVSSLSPKDKQCVMLLSDQTVHFELCDCDDVGCNVDQSEKMYEGFQELNSCSNGSDSNLQPSC